MNPVPSPGWQLSKWHTGVEAEGAEWDQQKQSTNSGAGCCKFCVERRGRERVVWGQSYEFGGILCAAVACVGGDGSSRGRSDSKRGLHGLPKRDWTEIRAHSRAIHCSLQKQRSVHQDTTAQPETWSREAWAILAVAFKSVTYSLAT